MPQYVKYPEDEYTRWEPGISLGGPIVKDKLWFFGSFLSSLEDKDRDVNFRSTGTTATYNQQTKTYYSSNNVTAQLTNNLRLKFAVNLSPTKEEGRLPNIDGFEQPDVELRHRYGAAEPDVLGQRRLCHQQQLVRGCTRRVFRS